MSNREPLSSGTVIAKRYRLEQVIGDGQFWMTYRARVPDSAVPVVVRECFPAGVAVRGTNGDVLPFRPDLTDALGWSLERAQQEAEALLGFSHPGIAEHSAAFRANGTLYSVREHIAGLSYMNWLASLHRLPSQDELDRISLRTLDALEAVHDRGLLHRDLTPDHVVIRQAEDSPVLIGFGAARSGFACHTRAIHDFVRPGYSPPEQYIFDESAQGPWTDIYALGALLYRAVTGRGAADVVTRNFNDDMPKAMSAPESLYRVPFLRAIDTALSLDASQRPQTIAQFRQALFQDNPAAKPSRTRAIASTKAQPSTRPASSVDSHTHMRIVRRAMIGAGSIVAVGLSAFVGMQLAGIANRKPQSVMLASVPAISEIGRTSDPKALQRMAAKFPAHRSDIETRLKSLGYIEVSLADNGVWRKPGDGEPFRDCTGCPEMLVIPAGAFLMGSPATEVGRSEDEDDDPGKGGAPVHESIPRALAIGRLSVTRGEFAEFVSNTGYKIEPGCYARQGTWQFLEQLSWQHPGFDQTDRHPVVCVSWRDSEAYVTWLGKKTGFTYRLPTEVEREYAARAPTGGRQSRYWFGDDEASLCDYANVADLDAKAVNNDWSVVNCHDGFIYTAPVASFKPNPFGLYDMHGNVWEWTADCYRRKLQQTRDPVPACNEGEPRVLRGGSWSDSGRMARAAARIASQPEIRDQIAGFRVVRELKRND